MRIVSDILSDPKTGALHEIHITLLPSTTHHELNSVLRRMKQKVVSILHVALHLKELLEWVAWLVGWQIGWQIIVVIQHAN